jgi:CubicO group peptidase (beta-lactamase class C family)
LLALLAIAAPAGARQATPVPPEFAPVREFIVRAIAEGRAPSVAVAVVRDGRVVWSEGIGTADRERGIPASPETRYWLASVSKPITATGLMRLVERGRIDLDAPANRYLPGAKLRAYRGSADDMTIRRLANHSAGMPTHFDFFYPPAAPPSMEETIRRYGFAYYAPGTQAEYSNLAYGILGYIVETVAGTSWSDFQQKSVYGPLGLRHTSDRAPAPAERNGAVPYAHDVAGRLVRVTVYDFDHRPASTIWSTANDLARFARMHLAGGQLDGTRILTAASVKEMQRQTGERSPGVGLGVAWHMATAFGRRTLWHTGGMPGVANSLNLFPDDNAATVVLTNGDDRAFVTELARRLGEGLFGTATPPAAQPAVPAAGPVAGSQAAPATPTELVGTWQGRLVHPDGEITVRVSVKPDGGVDMVLADRPPVALRLVELAPASLKGRVTALLATQPSYHGIPDLALSLTREGDRLAGVCSAVVPGYFTLPFWMDLTRAK